MNTVLSLLIQPLSFTVIDCFDCLDLHYSKPKGEPVSEARYN